MKHSPGSVLLLSLWATAFLAALGITQATKVSLELKWANRLEEARQSWYLAWSSMQVAATLLSKDDPLSDALNESWGQVPKEPIPFGPGTIHYQIFDEQARIPLNAAPADVLARLPGFTQQAADQLVQLRTQKQRILHLGELPALNLPGFRPELLPQLEPLVTVYGSGSININTASVQVLELLGIKGANQIAQYRDGGDGILGNENDRVFKEAAKILVDLENAQVILDNADKVLLTNLVSAGLVGVNSTTFRVETEGKSTRHGIDQKGVAILERSGAATPPVVRGWYEPR